MARTSNCINKADLKSLRKQVESIAGFEITRAVDCQRLSDLVLAQTADNLSFSTLKRFYGFVSVDFNYSYQTLDILSRFCGAKDWNNFIKKQKITLITKEELLFFSSVFESTDYYTFESHNESMQLIGRRIAERLRADPKAFEANAEELATKKMAQVFLFEHFPDYDNLVAYQYKGYIAYLKNKTTTEAQVFGNCLLFFRGFLLMDEAIMQEQHRILLQIKDVEAIHPMPLGRYYQCLLLFQHFVVKKPLTLLLKRIYLIEKKVSRTGVHFKDFPGFHYFVADALVLSKQPKEVLKIIALATKGYSTTREFVWKGYYRQLQLMMAEAHYQLKDVAAAKILIKKVKPQNFYFISQQYFTVRHQILWATLNNKKSITKQAERLIKKHSFFALTKIHQ